MEEAVSDIFNLWIYDLFNDLSNEYVNKKLIMHNKLSDNLFDYFPNELILKIVEETR